MNGKLKSYEKQVRLTDVAVRKLVKWEVFNYKKIK